MPETILYYPHIAIPSDKWLRQAILYWDEIGSIVPEGYKVERNADIHFLQDEGIYRDFRPQTLMYNWNLFESFQNELLDTLASDKFQRMLPPLNNRQLTTQIHIQKVMPDTFEFLESEGLAIRDNDNWEWYRFDLKTARVYMSLLAKYLAFSDGRTTIPGTDSPTYEGLSFYPTNDHNTSPGLNIDFFNVLPVPLETVSLQDIVQFKKIRSEELLHFRSELRNFQVKLRDAENITSFNDALNEFEGKINLGLTNLVAALNDSKMVFRLGSVKEIVLTSAAGLLAHVAVPLAIGWLGTAALKLSNIALKHQIETNAAIRNSSVGYLFHAQNSGIV